MVVPKKEVRIGPYGRLCCNGAQNAKRIKRKIWDEALNWALYIKVWV